MPWSGVQAPPLLPELPVLVELELLAVDPDDPAELVDPVEVAPLQRQMPTFGSQVFPEPQSPSDRHPPGVTSQ